MAPLSALSMVLNALNHDPGTAWKGPWRWNSEEMMLCGVGACGHTKEHTAQGFSVSDFTALARCKGVRAQAGLVLGKDDVMQFRQRLIAVCSDPESTQHIIVRGSEGSFCPVGGYNAERDMVLLLDVARHIRPPRWVSMDHVWRDMMSTGSEAGYVVLSTWNTEELKANHVQLCPAIVKSWSEHGPKSVCRFFVIVRA
jgi:glutathione gamma-glutamylcysteinyltransferase